MSRVVSLFEAAVEAKDRFNETAHRTTRVVSIRLNTVQYAMLHRVASEMGERPSTAAADLLMEALRDCFDAAGWDYQSHEAQLELHQSFEPVAPLGLGGGEEG